LWDVERQREVGVLRGHTDDITSVTFSPDGRVFASGSWDGTVLLWRTVPTVVEDEGQVAGGLPPIPTYLLQNYPNPFNVATMIRYGLSEAGEVRLEVSDVWGRRVRMLVAGRREARGYRIVWDGGDEQGRPVASGVYFYRLEMTGRGSIVTRRMLLLR
jgi:hypothetical protein